MYENAKAASPQKLGEYISRTYFALRFLMFFLAVFFPLSLWVWSTWHFGTIEPGASISGYYYAEWATIRNHFVGTLSAIGICLIAYRGFTDWENWLLNVAGLAVIGVAMFPTTVDQAPRMTLQQGAAANLHAKAGQMISIHGACAITFFICLAVVALTQSDRSLRWIEVEKRKQRFLRTYRVIGVLMVAFPVGAWFILQATQRNWGIFAVEACAVLVFAAYWLVKTLEFRGTEGEAEMILLGIDFEEAADN